MKTTLLTVVAAFFGVSALATAQETKPAKPAPVQKPAAPAKPAPPAKKDEEKPLPMNAKVDAIDASAKTFSHTNKTGVKVTFHVTSKTEIHQGDKEAKFSDIKVGDTVAGLRIKKSVTDYEVVKITKFGVVEPKTDKKGEAKPAPAPAPAKKS